MLIVLIYGLPAFVCCLFFFSIVKSTKPSSPLTTNTGLFVEPPVFDLKAMTSCDTISHFFKKYIDLILAEGTEQVLVEIIRFGNGDYLMAGFIRDSDDDDDHQQRPEGYLISIDSLGNINWAKHYGNNSLFEETLPYTGSNDISEYFRHITAISDSTAIVVGNRRGRGGMIMKVDWHGNVLWSKKYLPDTYPHFQVSKSFLSNNGNLIWILSYRKALYNKYDNYILNIDKENGNLINAYSYNHALETNRLESISSLNGGYYMISNLYQNADTFSREYGILNSITNANFNTINNTAIYSQFNDTLKITPSTKEIIKLNGLFYFSVAFYNNLSNSINYGAGLIALDSNLNIVHKKIYRLLTPSGGNVIGWLSDLHLNKDGTIHAAHNNHYYYYGQSAIALQLDSFGNILHQEWTHQHFTEQGPGCDKIIAGTGDPNHLAFQRTDNFVQEAECDYYYGDSLIVENPLFETDTMSIDMIPIPDAMLTDIHLPARTIYPHTREACCDMLPDANIVYVHPAYPCGDSIGIAIKFCNTGTVPLPFDYPISVYDSNPTLGAAMLLSQFTIDTTLTEEECWIMPRTIPIPTTSQVYVVAGDPGTNSTYEIPCDLPLAPIEECSYLNNFRSAHIPDTISIVTFDNEYFLVCPWIHDTIQLTAPPYLYNPVWNGIWATDTLTVYHGGTYYLEATTPCGEPFVDSLFVDEQLPHLEFPWADTTICMGDTIIVQTPPPFQIIGWSDLSPEVESFCVDTCKSRAFIGNVPGSYTIFGYTINNSPNVAFCAVDDSFNIHVLPTIELTFDSSLCAGSTIELHGQSYLAADTTLYFSFSGINGCDSSRIYNLQVADTFYQVIDTLACPGDTLWWEGSPIPSGQSQSFSYTSLLGCDSTVVVQVNPLSTFTTNEQLAFCPGDSVLVFGEWQSEEGAYQATFAAVNGCDSLHQIELSASLLHSQTEEQPAICHGDSILLFNQWQTQAGFYEQYYTAFNGCDSLHIVDLIVYPEISMEWEAVPSCPNEATGRIQLSTLSGSPPFEFQWIDGILTDSVAEQLSTGNYSLTITDNNNCSQVFDFTVPLHSSSSFDAACTSQWYAPTAFSPNGDGFNDRYTFYANERALRIEQVQIWDRWGNQVFGANDIPFNDELLGWDGKLKGKDMLPAVFVWKATVVLEGGVREVAYGDFVLIR